MTKRRKATSLTILLCFILVMTSGFLEYFLPHTRLISTLHTTFGFLFTLGVALHLLNNYRPIKAYLRSRRISVVITTLVVILIMLVYIDISPLSNFMDFGSRLRARQKQEQTFGEYIELELNSENDIKLLIDLVRAEHYWHPQMAIWTETPNGQFLETVFVTTATARGLFYGGRSKENFKDFDASKADKNDEYRRVNALPIWSRKRGVRYPDGMFVPTASDPMPDGITGATISDNFLLNTSSSPPDSTFRLKLEINVAFDDNEYYSEYDFPDDTIYHAGTGQLGQPSIVFETVIDMNDGKDYYLMDLIGHGHHSGQDGRIYADLTTLTTALEIVERIVVGVNVK